MKKKTKLLTVSLPEECVDRIKEEARKCDRPISNYVYVMLKKASNTVSLPAECIDRLKIEARKNDMSVSNYIYAMLEKASRIE